MPDTYLLGIGAGGEYASTFSIAATEFKHPIS
jgi:ATP-dependent protease HslVU (ClpYQ) peptidase subunit